MNVKVQVTGNGGNEMGVVFNRLSVVERELLGLKAGFERLKAESKRARSCQKLQHKRFKSDPLFFKVAAVDPVEDSDRSFDLIE